MQLYLFRHGIADPAPPDGSDFDRPLSPLGLRRTREAAEGFARFADAPGVLLTSPKPRAAQTAAILGDVLDLVPVTEPALADQPPLAIRRALLKRPESAVLLVGHEPTLSQLATLLLTGRPGRGVLQLKKAACCRIDAPLREDEPAGVPELVWSLPPRALRTLGNAR